MKKYKILLDGKYTIFITASNGEDAKEKAKLYGGGTIELVEVTQ